MAIKFLNTVQVDTDVLYVDTANDRVGIGTTSPIYKLDVVSAGNALLSLTGVDKPVMRFMVGTSTVGTIQAQENNSMNVSAYGTSSLNLQTVGTTPRLTILTGGNVGIGTTAPQSKLQINDGSVNVTKAMQSGGVDHDFLQLSYAGSWANNVGGLASINFTDNLSSSNTVGRIGVTYTGSQGKFVVTDLYSGGYAGSGDVFTIQADGQTYIKGNVGIGTTSPSAKLSLYDATEDVSINVNTGTGGSYPKKTGISFGATSTSLGGDAEFTGGAGIQAINTAASNNITDLAFWTTTGGSPTERMRIDSSGYVGIGTTSPDSKLNIEGPKNTAILTLGNTTAGSSWVVGDRVGGIDFYSGDGSGGGIGVKASISYEDAVGGTGSSQAMVFRTGGNTSGTNNVERMRLQYNGNVGIGTTSPSARLEVQGTNSNTQAALKVTDSGDSFFEVVPDNNTTFKIGDLDAVGDEAMIVGTFSDITFSKGGTTTMILDSNNNVGIGTTSPGAKLDVSGNLRADSVQLFSGGTQYLSVGSYSSAPWINTGSSGGLINFGAPSSNTTNVYVQGTVEARDGLLGFVPTFVHGGFYHSSSSSSSAIYWIPSNYISETTSTQYYNRFVAPYPGRVKKVIMRWTNGATPTATSVTFRKTQNGGVSSTQYAATVTGGATTSMVATKEFSNTDFTFNAGDKYGIGFMTNGGTRFLYGMTYTLVIEYDI